MTSTSVRLKRRRDEIEEKIEALSKVIDNMTGSKKYFLQTKLQNVKLKQQKLVVLSLSRFKGASGQNLMTELDKMIVENEIDMEIESIRSSKKFKLTENMYFERLFREPYTAENRAHNSTPNNTSATLNISADISNAQSEETNILTQNILKSVQMCDKSTNTGPVIILELLNQGKSVPATNDTKEKNHLLPRNKSRGKKLSSDTERTMQKKNTSVKTESSNTEDATKMAEHTGLQFNEQDSIQLKWFENSFKTDQSTKENIEPISTQPKSSNNKSMPIITEKQSNGEPYHCKSACKILLTEMSNNIKSNEMEKTDSNILQKNAELPTRIAEHDQSENMQTSTKSQHIPVQFCDFSYQIKRPALSTKCQNQNLPNISEDLSKKFQDKPARFQDLTNKCQDQSARSQDLSYRLQDYPAKSKNLSKDKYLTKKCQDKSANSKILSNRYKDHPTKSKKVPHKCQEQPGRSQDLSKKNQKPPANSENLSNSSQNHPAKCKGLLNKCQSQAANTKDLSNKCQDQSTNSRILSISYKDHPTKSKDLSNKCQDPPAYSENLSNRCQEHSAKCKDLNKECQGQPAYIRKLSTKCLNQATNVKNLSKKCQDQLAKSKDLSNKCQDQPARTRDLCHKCQDLPPKSKYLFNKSQDQLSKTKDLNECKSPAKLPHFDWLSQDHQSVYNDLYFKEILEMVEKYDNSRSPVSL